MDPDWSLHTAYPRWRARAGLVCSALPARRVRFLALCLILAGCESRASHAYIPNFDARELEAFGVKAQAGRQGGEPPTPSGPLRSGQEMPMVAGSEGEAQERPGRRATSFRPDRVTDLEGTLGYYGVFSPTIAPFKRVSALDAVRIDGDVPVLSLSSQAREVVPVEGTDTSPDAASRDLFWGSVVLDFSGGPVLPLPSVSPDSRILRANTDPPSELTFERDVADNYFVRAKSVFKKQVRLNYLMDAPRSYFGAGLPQTRLDVLKHEVAPLPPALSRAALRVAERLGVEPSMSARAGLSRLVEHFRSFEESKTPPADTGQIYRDLAEGKLGVCRHRAYAFVITAQALGVPSRFVQNEAHAWVELKLPEVGWLRVDLGGAAQGLETHAAVRPQVYVPAEPDPWPRPPAFEDSYRRAAQLAAAGPSRGPGQTREPGDTRALPTLAAGQSMMSEPPVDDGREPTFLHITSYPSEVMRGDSFELTGFARDVVGAGVAGLRIEVSLASPVAAEAVLLGVSVTDAKGRFRVSLTVPPSQLPDDYVLVVVTPGDGHHAAARAF